MSITKQELSKIISARLGCQEKEAHAVITELIEMIIQSIAEDGKIDIRDLGVFKVVLRQACRKWNCNTSEFYDAPERLDVKFIPVDNIARRINTFYTSGKDVGKQTRGREQFSTSHSDFPE